MSGELKTRRYLDAPVRVATMLRDRELSLEVGRVGPLADAVVTARHGSTSLLASVVSKWELGGSFLPLQVDYREKSFGSGTIPGTLNRREPGITDRETLAARAIDRTLRPLFPKGYFYDTQIIISVLSFDEDCDPVALGITAASAALHVSDIPWYGPAAAVRVGWLRPEEQQLIDAAAVPPAADYGTLLGRRGHPLLCPTSSEYESSASNGLDLLYCSTEDRTLMLEVGASQIREEDLIRSLRFAHAAVQPVLHLQDSLRHRAGRSKRSVPLRVPSPALLDTVRGMILSDARRMYRQHHFRKADRGNAQRLLYARISEDLTPTLSNRDREVVGAAVDMVVKEALRGLVLEGGAAVAACDTATALRGTVLESASGRTAPVSTPDSAAASVPVESAVATTAVTTADSHHAGAAATATPAGGELVTPGPGDALFDGPGDALPAGKSHLRHLVTGDAEVVALESAVIDAFGEEEGAALLREQQLLQLQPQGESSSNPSMLNPILSSSSAPFSGSASAPSLQSLRTSAAVDASTTISSCGFPAPLQRGPLNASAATVDDDDTAQFIVTDSTGCRPDGRSTTSVRRIQCEVDVLPAPVHGSSLFSRGDTQVVCTATLGPLELGQTLRPATLRLSDVPERKPFFLHYDFPPYSTNETGKLGGPNRRMVGHGALAERALLPLLPQLGSGGGAFPYSVRVTSEVSGSDGSSSMATVCGASLALMDAGVPLRAPAAGISIGLVSPPPPVTVRQQRRSDDCSSSSSVPAISGVQGTAVGNAAASASIPTAEGAVEATVAVAASTTEAAAAVASTSTPPFFGLNSTSTPPFFGLVPVTQQQRSSVPSPMAAQGTNRSSSAPAAATAPAGAAVVPPSTLPADGYITAGGSTSTVVAATAVPAAPSPPADGFIEGAHYALLTDIFGLEDHAGDMDFKVAGTRYGITAAQLDIKPAGVPLEVLEAALFRARDARLFVLEAMAATLPTHRPELKDSVPRAELLTVAPEALGKLLGPGGSVLRRISEATNTRVTVDSDTSPNPTVTLYNPSADMLATARGLITTAMEDFRRVSGSPFAGTAAPGAPLLFVGSTITCTVLKVLEFGVVLGMGEHEVGWMHISEFTPRRTGKVTDVLAEGDTVTVLVVDVDSRGRAKFSMRVMCAAGEWDVSKFIVKAAGVGAASAQTRPAGADGDRGAAAAASDSTSKPAATPAAVTLSAPAAAAVRARGVNESPSLPPLTPAPPQPQQQHRQKAKLQLQESPAAAQVSSEGEGPFDGSRSNAVLRSPPVVSADSGTRIDIDSSSTGRDEGDVTDASALALTQGAPAPPAAAAAVTASKPVLPRLARAGPTPGAATKVANSSSSSTLAGPRASAAASSPTNPPSSVPPQPADPALLIPPPPPSSSFGTVSAFAVASTESSSTGEILTDDAALTAAAADDGDPMDVEGLQRFTPAMFRYLQPAFVSVRRRRELLITAPVPPVPQKDRDVDILLGRTPPPHTSIALRLGRTSVHKGDAIRIYNASRSAAHLSKGAMRRDKDKGVEGSLIKDRDLEGSLAASSAVSSATVTMGQ